MNYAQLIRDNYFKNKDRVAKIRRQQGLSYVLTLEDAINDGYKHYSDFCYNIGVTPKTKTEFLRTKTI